MGVDRAAAEVELVGLTKRFSDTLAVDAVDLTVPRGSFFALLGPSGCGKTTTLRMVAGLEQPTEGRVLLDGEDITDRKPYKRPVNTVFQNYALFPHLDVAENVAFGLRRRRVDDAEVRRRVGAMLDLVELGGMQRRRPSQLSGGQQQRVALARALINEPQVLLLDEPLGALDLKLRKQMQIELKRIQDEVGVTFVHVTHDQEEAMTMADLIAVMDAGRIEQLGTPAELYERPRTSFVANFLGQSNLLEGAVEGRDGELAILVIHDEKIRVPAALVPDRGTVEVGVRPEKITIAAADGTSGDGITGTAVNELRGTVTDRSFVGVSNQYLVRTAWGQELQVFSQNVGNAAVERGEAVVMRWAPEDTFVVAAAGS